MKKLMAAFLALALLVLTWTAAVADFNLPKDMTDRLARDGIGTKEVVSWIPRVGNSDFSFLTVRTAKGRNYLYGFRQEQGSWKLYVKTEAAIPDGSMAVLLQDNSAVAGRPSFTTYYEAGDLMEMCCEWQYRSSVWKLQGVYHYGYYKPSAGLMFFDTSREGKLHLWNTGWVDRPTNVWLEGTVQTDLRYFDLSAFPLTLNDARKGLTVAPEIPYGSLGAQNIKFTGGRKYDVYSGPGTNYLRGGNGKAVVSTNDWIQVFGRENGWILIQYAITKDHMRFGWIPEKALPKNAQVGGAGLVPVSATLGRAVTLTDDPLYSQAALISLPAGSRVTMLATMGDWAYVESASGSLVRGFVPMDALTTGTTFDLASCPAADGEAVMEGQLTVSGYTVNARIRAAADGPLPADAAAYRIYDSQNGQLLMTAGIRDGEGYLAGTGRLLASTAGLRIVAVDAAGAELTDWAVTVQW